MNRQLFLHHYFPSLYFSVLLLAATFDLFTTSLKPKIRVQFAVLILAAAIWAWYHWSALIYAGKWTKEDCEDAKWLKNWDFSCGDFYKDYSDYDSIAHPTPSKPVVQIHGGTSAPAVEAVTSEIVQVVQPGKDAFAAPDNDPPPAPKSEVGNADMLSRASAAHEEAEAKDKAAKGIADDKEALKEQKMDQVPEKEPVPTNLPGAEMPAKVADAILKDKQEQEREKLAQIPLEEAAPTGGKVEGKDGEQGTEQQASERLQRLAEIDDQAKRENKVKDGQKVIEVEKEPEPIQGNVEAKAHEEAPVVPEKNEEKPAAKKDDAPVVAEDAEKKPVENEEVPAVRPPPIVAAEEGAKKQEVILDDDAKAALEERERHKAVEGENKQAG